MSQFRKNCAQLLYPAPKILTAFSAEEVERKKMFLRLNIFRRKRSQKVGHWAQQLSAISRNPPQESFFPLICVARKNINFPHHVLPVSVPDKSDKSRTADFLKCERQMFLVFCFHFPNPNKFYHFSLSSFQTLAISRNAKAEK